MAVNQPLNLIEPTERSEFQRCVCNKLLCVINGDNIEIKCNKCKRVMIIQTKGIEGVEVR
jgi:phage FluMu protein Com